MAKISLDRIKKKYGWSGGKYQELISKILNQNVQNISSKVGQIKQDHWKKAFSRIGSKEKKFVVPDLSDILPARSVFSLKSAEKGKLISDTLRDSITRNLKDTMNQFTPKTKEPTYLRRAGAKKGTINPKLINQFEQKIRGTFRGYTKKDPSFGMPSNVHTIAVTEMRSAINSMKKEYMMKLKEKNPNLILKKKWNHNSSLSKNQSNIRRGHQELDGKTIPFDEDFSVRVYKKIGGRNKYITTIKMNHPHDPNAPAGEVIGCNCDIEYLAQERA